MVAGSITVMPVCCPQPVALEGAFTSGYIERNSFEEVTGGSMVVDDHFTEAERAYLTAQRLARIATASPDGEPDVAVVGFALWLFGPDDPARRTRGWFRARGADLLTGNAKGVVPSGHPLCADTGLGFGAVQVAVEQCDAVLVVGTELSDTDLYNGGRALQFAGPVVRIDLDPEQMRERAVDCGLGQPRKRAAHRLQRPDYRPVGFVRRSGILEIVGCGRCRNRSGF